MAFGGRLSPRVAYRFNQICTLKHAHHRISVLLHPIGYTGGKQAKNAPISLSVRKLLPTPRFPLLRYCQSAATPPSILRVALPSMAQFDPQVPTSTRRSATAASG